MLENLIVGNRCEKGPACLSRHAQRLEAAAFEEATTNPVSMYKKIESLIAEWNSLLTIMNTNILSGMVTPPLYHPSYQHTFLTDLIDNASRTTPSAQHSFKLATALFRIQDVYELTPAEIASRMVPGFEEAENLTSMLSRNNRLNRTVIAFSKRLL